MNIKRTPPTHAVIQHRITGQAASPEVPLTPKMQEAWPYAELHPSFVLLKYMDFFKFKWMLENKGLYFARLDQFDDPYEGRFTEVNESLEGIYPFARTSEEARAQHEGYRRCLFASCWHINHKEELPMWNAYTTKTESVVIWTSVRALNSHVPKSINKSPVLYHGSNFQRIAFGWDTLAFYKPNKYSFEREFRMLRNIQEGDVFTDKDISQKVLAEPKKIIHQINTHPKASKAFKAEIDSLLIKHLPGLKRRDSALA